MISRLTPRRGSNRSLLLSADGRSGTARLMNHVALAALLALPVTACSSPDTETAAKPSATKPAATESANKAAAPKASAMPVVVLKTNKGTIEVELNSEKAPLSVANFLEYVDAGHYDGTVFHRVIKGFMIQGGGFGTDKAQKKVNAPIKNEANNGLLNKRGTLAMARTGVVDSATAQFFINTVDNTFLNHRSPTPQGYGYAVFGKVISGMDVVDAIEGSATSNQGGAFVNAPNDPVIIEKATRK